MNARCYLPVCPPYGRCTVSACRHHAWGAQTGCTLDVACDGAHSFVEIADILGVCRERVRQIEAIALRKARASAMRQGITLESMLPLASAVSWDDVMPASVDDE